MLFGLLCIFYCAFYPLSMASELERFGYRSERLCKICKRTQILCDVNRWPQMLDVQWAKFDGQVHENVQSLLSFNQRESSNIDIIMSKCIRKERKLKSGIQGSSYRVATWGR